MATLEDRMLDPEGTKRDNYCSSSEGESEGEEAGKGAAYSFHPHREAASASGQGSYNTGPKGVIEDWRRFKQLENEKREEQTREMHKLSHKLSKSCRTAKDDERAKLEKEDEDLIAELDTEDEFLRSYMQKRMKEMKMAADTRAHCSTYGKVFELTSAEEFLSVTDKDSISSTVLVHIYEKDITGCEAMNGCFSCIAKDYPMVKLCKVRASLLGTSKNFRKEGVPAVQAYRGGELVNSFIRLTDEFGEDFFSDEVEGYLKDYGVLPDLAAWHSVNKDFSRTFGTSPPQNEPQDGDSDFSVD